jgi:hypothetical protein
MGKNQLIIAGAEMAASKEGIGSSVEGVSHQFVPADTVVSIPPAPQEVVLQKGEKSSRLRMGIAETDGLIAPKVNNRREISAGKLSTQK